MYLVYYIAFLFLVGTLGSCMELRKTENNGTSLRLLTNSESRIVGGVEATPHEFFWLTRIQRKRDHSLVCGGTIIGPNLILTAAHCIDNAEDDANAYEVLAGAHDMNAQEGTTRQTRNIRRINCHRQFNSMTFQNDICVIVLASNLTWTNAVGSAMLANASSTIPSSVTTAGFGVTEEGDPVTSSLLMKVTVPTISKDQCSFQYKGEVEITDSMICAGISGKDSCQGDSGGPLMCVSERRSTFVCGIVSFGAGCGRENFSGVYTKVGNFRDWISENTGNSISFIPMITLFSSLAVLFLFCTE